MEMYCRKTAGRGAILLGTGLAFAMASAAARAEDAPQNDWNFTLGAVGFLSPDFQGSKDYSVRPLPDVRVEYRDLFFASFGGIGYNAINGGGWRAGPIAKYAFGRDEGDNVALRGLGDIDGSFEVGGFVEYSLEPFSLSLELRRAVGGHDGFVAELGVDHSATVDVLGLPLMLSAGPRLNLADGAYMNTFFGIDNGQAARSGLARYTADAGIVSYGVGAFAMLPVTDSIALSLFGNYERLGPQAADSPLVARRGSENQIMLGLGLSYRFGL